MTSHNSNSPRATQADDDQMIGGKSIFTPEFQKRLFAHCTSDQIAQLERLMSEILKGPTDGFTFPPEDACQSDICIESAALRAADACSGLVLLDAVRVLKRAQQIIHGSVRLNPEDLRKHPLWGAL
jgi:hypothetical protein